MAQQAPAARREQLTITQLRERTGLAASALRFYEQRGLLRPTGRAGGRRLYDPDAVEHLALIDLLQAAGFTLTEIKELVGEGARFSAGWRAAAVHKLAQLDAQLDQLRRARQSLRHMIDCRSEVLDECPVHRAVVRAHAQRRHR